MNVLIAVAALLAALLVPVPGLAQTGLATVALVADGSGTATASDRAAICLPLFKRVVSGLAPGDTVMLVTVDEKPFTKKLALYEGALAPASNRIRAKLDRDRLGRELKTASEAWLAQSALLSRYGDAFLFVADHFRKSPARSKKLFVCGDGAEEGPVLDLSRTVSGDALKRFAGAGLVPADALAGVEVEWVGFGAGEAAHVDKLRRFWEGYFGATKANVLRLQRSGAGQ